MTINLPLGLSESKSVGEWVAADYRLANVFSRHGIDFCCGGSRPVAEACAEKGISVETLLSEAQGARETSGVGEQYNQWSLDFLADYIVNQFHVYTREMLGQVDQYAGAVAHAHGAAHPETVTIAALWRSLGAQMTAHLRDEEELLFPSIKQLVQRGPAGDLLPSLAPGSAQALIAQMGAEHEEVGDTLAELERLSGGYAVPADGCNTYRALYGSMAEFEATTKKHIHLENNILFPKALRLAQERAGAAG